MTQGSVTSALSDNVVKMMKSHKETKQSGADMNYNRKMKALNLKWTEVDDYENLFWPLIAAEIKFTLIA